MNPAKMKWQEPPLPSPNLIHPQSRIIAWCNPIGSVEPELLVLQPRDTYWEDTKHRAHGATSGWISYWAWQTSFHKNNEVEQ